MLDNSALHAKPIASRPPISWGRTLKAITFFILFNFGCLMVNAFQFIFLLPLRVLPFHWSMSMYDEGVRYTKGAFGCLLSMPVWILTLNLDSTYLSSHVPGVCAYPTPDYSGAGRHGEIQ